MAWLLARTEVRSETSIATQIEATLIECVAVADADAETKRS